MITAKVTYNRDSVPNNDLPYSLDINYVISSDDPDQIHEMEQFLDRQSELFDNCKRKKIPAMPILASRIMEGENDTATK